MIHTQITLTVNMEVTVHHIVLNGRSPPVLKEGFTLIELLISITVLTILLVLTVPSFKDMLMNNRITAHTDALSSALHYARNIALSQNMNVMACPFGAAGSTACGGSWQNGWIIVSQPATGAPVLLQAKNTGPNDPVISATAPSVTFDARGIASTQGNFTICDSRGGAFAQSVQVLPTGFVQSGSTMGIAVWDGNGITCP